MYTVYYDSGTTNTRAFLVKDGKIAGRLEEQIGARNSALAGDNTVLVSALYEMYLKLLEMENISEENVEEIYMSGMISCPSGLVEVEHLPVPVDRDKLKASLFRVEEPRFFKRTINIVPGIKTLGYGEMAAPQTACDVNIMRGEEIEIFGILRSNPELAQGNSILVLPGSHTQVAFVRGGCIEGISSNVTGELYRAVTKETILGASVAGEEPWEMDDEMICLGYENVHTYGFNRALYILRVLDLFTEADLNKRRSYLEGVLNAGVMDAIAQASDGQGGKLAVVGNEIQFSIYSALCRKHFPQFTTLWIKNSKDMPFSVSGLLALTEK